ncbi:MAG: 50S ribosomal protein L17 [Candidatus Saganbacteria bacterium]|nr:50S ribosomal protein L17 [Candidatus Saganbacteria bacterium]
MRHGKKNKRLSKPNDQRIAILKGLIESLIDHEKIVTSMIRAKEAARLAERIITWAKGDDVASRRKVGRFIRDKALLKKVFELAGKRMEGRPGGYTRITKIGFRRGDGAPLVCLEIL